MAILFKKLLAQLLFWIYDFIDTIGTIFNILTGTQAVEEKRTLLQVFVDSAVSTKVLLGLCLVSIIIAGACMGVKTVKNVIQFKSGGEQPSHALTVKQGFFAVISSVACIFFVLLFIAFASMLLNMVNDVISPEENMTLSQRLFDLSVEESYVIDESVLVSREVDYYDDFGNRVQETDADGNLVFETDSYGNLIKDENGKPIPVYLKKTEWYYDYLRDEQGNPILESGWVNGHTAADISWSMSPNDVFGVHNKDWLNLFEQEDKGYRRQPIVRMDSFNFLTAYLVAIVMLISMFMLSVGLVKRICDIIVLIICMPLVCGTIPLDDGARFRAWRETFMSKVLVVFGAVISLNVFFMISKFITGPTFNLMNLVNDGVLSLKAVSIFKMLMLLGGALCINGSQALIARILGTSADESREAMQSFAMITSGVRFGIAGAVGAGRAAMGAKRMLVGGRNRYGRESVGLVPRMMRGVNYVGERVGGEGYSGSRGAAFVRKLGRMGGMSGRGALAAAAAGGGNANANNSGAGGRLPLSGLDKPNVGEHKSNTAFTAPAGNSKAVAPIAKPQSNIRPTNGGLRTNSGSNKSGAFSNDSRKRK